MTIVRVEIDQAMYSIRMGNAFGYEFWAWCEESGRWETLLEWLDRLKRRLDHG